MTNEEFYKTLLYLKAKYPNWNIRIDDPFTLSVWYEDFENIDLASMKQMCRDYSRMNKYPPNSPADLLNLIPKYLSVEEACELIRDCVGRNNNPEYFMRDLYSKNQTTYNVVKGLETEFYQKDSFDNNCVGYALRVFKQRYINFLNEQKIAYVGNNLIENKNQNLLGE
jgi:hypothetical protein